MARECEGPDGVMKIVCPVHHRLRHGAGTDADASPPGRVEWAGLPIDLDLAFSHAQRDKVYLQHLMREREAQLWRRLHGGTRLCVCDNAADGGHLVDPHEAYAGPLDADMRSPSGRVTG